jgi:hypothetical protein
VSETGPYVKGERVEVYDALITRWRDATVLEDQTPDAFGVFVKVDRIREPVRVDAALVRRPGPYLAYGGWGRPFRELD